MLRSLGYGFSRKWSEITDKPGTFPPSAHTHVIGDVTGLQTALDGKALLAHTHAIADVTGLQAALDSKAATSAIPTWGTLAGKPSTFPPSAHTHIIADTTGLQAALDAKAATSAIPVAAANAPPAVGAASTVGTALPYAREDHTHQSGMFLVGAPTVTALSTGEKNGTAFQPRAAGPCFVNITASMSGVLNTASAVTVALSPTSGGTYTTVSLFSLTLNVAGVGVSDSSSGCMFVPTGYWVKITQTGVSILGNVAMNRVVWNL